MGSSKEDSSLMALYRISRRDRIPGSTQSLKSSSKPTGLDVVAMDFVRTWRDIENLTQPSSTLDVDTLSWKTWTKQSNRNDGNSSNETHSMDQLRMHPQSQEPMYHLTKAEFRRLTDQLRDVNWNISNRFKGSGFNRFRGSADGDTGSTNSACLYRSQLAFSNKAFNDEQKVWEPYVHPRPAGSVYTRCRPVSHTVTERERQPRIQLPTKKRPKSSPIRNSRMANDVSWGDYDALTTNIVNSFQADEGLKANFGEKILVTGKDRTGEQRKEIITKPLPECSPSFKQAKSETTSGVASLNSDSEDEAEGGKLIRQADSGSSSGVADEVEESEPIAADDDKSDDDRIPEPPIPYDKQGTGVPKITWSLRPEKLDAAVMLEGKKDRHRYDFDASYIRQPNYEFNDAFSTPLMALDLQAIAEREATLELKSTVDKTEAKVIMRCLELARLELATERIENARSSKVKPYIRQKSATAMLSRPRAQSAKSKPGATKCVQECMQVACVGDCPQKSAGTQQCSSCGKKSCNGNCSIQPYSNHIRNGDEPTAQPKYRLARPKSCSFCSKENNLVKKINQLEVSLGRPKSSHSTYSHARKSVRQSLDLRASTQQLDVNQIPANQMVNRRPRTAPVRLRSARVRRGRDSVAPHKSFSSQRRISLTTNSVRPVFGGKPPRYAKNYKSTS